MRSNTPPVNQGQTTLSRVASFEDVTEGAWVNRDGILYRVPSDALKPGHSPTIDIVSSEPMEFTKLSENSNEPINKLRRIAANLDIAVRF